MNWLNSNSAAITAIATVLLTFITGYYAFITLGLLRENKEIRTAMNQPDLAIYATVQRLYKFLEPCRRECRTRSSL
jgi:hypothetical protein